MATSKQSWEALREQQNYEEQKAFRGKFNAHPVEPETAPEERGLSFNISSLLDASKQQITDISKSIVQRVADGEIDVFKAYLHNKKILELATLNEKNLRPHINSKGIPKAGLTMYNVSFTAKSDASKWDFSECKDREYENLLSDMEVLKEKIKKKETVLKNMDKPEERVDTDTGETYTVYPAKEITGAENFAASLK